MSVNLRVLGTEPIVLKPSASEQIRLRTPSNIVSNVISVNGKQGVVVLTAEDIGASGVPTNVRQAIYTLLNSAAYATTGLTDEIAVVESWAEEVTSLTLNKSTLSLSNNTPQTITATVVPSGSTVTWSSSDTDVATVVAGVVTGVGNGSCVITATAGDKSATCSVTVSGFKNLESISAVYTQSGTVYEYTPLNDLKTDLVVTATFDDTSTETVPSADYTLSGALRNSGTSTVTVTYGGKQTTFSVTVTSVWVNDVCSMTSSDLRRAKIQAEYPYYGSNNNRVTYIGTDINASTDYDYKFEYTTTYSGSTNIGVQWLTPAGYAKVINHTDLVALGTVGENEDRGDVGWQSNGYEFAHTVPQVGLRAFWFTFRAGSGSTSITTSNFPTVTITRTAVSS